VFSVIRLSLKVHLLPFNEGFVQDGTLTVGDSLVVGYDYDIRKDNQNALTLQSLSLNAPRTMKVSGGKYISDYQIYLDYYGDELYANKWIESAADGNFTGFSSGYVEWDEVDSWSEKRYPF
jgi:hypothetical protein